MRRVGCGVLLLMTMLVHGVAAGAELGRLFLSSAERAAIDVARQGTAKMSITRSSSVEQSTATATQTLSEAPAETVTVNGYIARSAGASTVWVNGRDIAAGKLSAPGRDGRRVSVPLANGGGQVALKPGQSFDPGSRQVSDAYQQQRPAPRE